MPTSEARILANRRNAALSTGPKTPEGKDASRRNGLKHGMTGAGVVVPEPDSARIESLAERLRAEMAPKTAMGAALIVQIATLSVRVERCFAHDVAATRYRQRHAVEAFDDERYDEAEALLETLDDAPRKNLRKLKRTPEGVEALIGAWHDLRAKLDRGPGPEWTPADRDRAEILAGGRLDPIRTATIHDLSATILDRSADEPTRSRARSELVAVVDGQIKALEAHYETLDFEAIEEDRAEAPDRALFDPSKGATLARRYESEALRNFHKALKEFRRVEAEAQIEAEAPFEALPPAPQPSALGSSRQTPTSSPRVEPSTPLPTPARTVERPDDHARTADGRVFQVGRAPVGAV